MAQDLYELRDAVLALAGEERESLLALIDHEEQKVPIQPNREEQEVWEVLIAVTPQGGVRHRSLTEFLRSKRHGLSRKAYDERVAEIYTFVAQTQTVRHPVQDHAALLRIVMGCLVADMQERSCEVHPAALLEALPRLRIAVDNRYPGYLAAGMLHRLIRAVAA